MNDPWFFDENFNGITDEFFDDVIKNFDFPLEDLEPGVEDWNANFQSLEPPPLNVLSDLSEVTKNNSYNRAPQPKQRPSPGDTSSRGSIFLCNNTNDGKDSRLFQTSSPVSVLESSGSCSAENLASINPKLVFPVAVKRTRSKRRRPSTFNSQFMFPFISPTSSASEEYHPSTASESGSETHSHEKPARKKQKRKKNLTMLSCSKENKKPYSQQSVAIRKCMHCEVTETPQWREGPMGPKTLCNACGVRYRSGRLLPEYRPAASPTFIPSLHSNSHKRVMEMRNRSRQ